MLVFGILLVYALCWLLEDGAASALYRGRLRAKPAIHHTRGFLGARDHLKAGKYNPNTVAESKHTLHFLTNITQQLGAQGTNGHVVYLPSSSTSRFSSASGSGGGKAYRPPPGYRHEGYGVDEHEVGEHVDDV